MKVKDLLEEIERLVKVYGEGFLDWEVYTEQINEIDKKFKREKQEWNIMKDEEDWEYFECAGFWTCCPNKKIFTINVNY